MKSYDKMTPYELGETGQSEALRYLKDYLTQGTTNERRLAASAVSKIAAKYNPAAKELIPYLMSNLTYDASQVRQYSLKALEAFELSGDELEVIKSVAASDSQSYNRIGAQRILQKHEIPLAGAVLPSQTGGLRGVDEVADSFENRPLKKAAATVKETMVPGKRPFEPLGYISKVPLPISSFKQVLSRVKQEYHLENDVQTINEWMVHQGLLAEENSGDRIIQSVTKKGKALGITSKLTSSNHHVHYFNENAQRYIFEHFFLMPSAKSKDSQNHRMEEQRHESDAKVDKKSKQQKTIPRHVYLSEETKNMPIRFFHSHETYTANYVPANHNFVIQNIPGQVMKDAAHYPMICVLKNILMRGRPTRPSQYLHSQFSQLSDDEELCSPCFFISNVQPVWLDTIKGHDESNDQTAVIFFEEIIEEYLGEYGFIKQLLLPEVSIGEITLADNQHFIDEKVDFYLPQAHLVIEIDGFQHQQNLSINMNDKERSRYLEKYKVKTIRINAKDIKQRTHSLQEKMRAIKNRLMEFEEILGEYQTAYCHQEEYYSQHENHNKMQLTAVMRFQILLLSLLEKGHIKLSDKKWQFAIVNRDVEGYANMAVQDLLLWVKELSKLMKLPFVKPQVIIKEYPAGASKHHENWINIDFSLLQRWTDENEADGEEDRIYVRTDYFDSRNYFFVSVANPINYDIVMEGKNNDIGAMHFILKNIFGYDQFAPGQRAAIINSLSGRQTIGLLPTGGGKSLIYQYVGLLQPCISFVVTPIKSLMQDQKESLDRFGIHHTNYINSNQSADEKSEVQKYYGSGKYQFVWISPERFQTIGFREQLEVINHERVIGLAIIDEVHCLSEWGHDFRTAYLNLAKTINKFCPSARILALTATASVNVLKDIMIEFDISRDDVKTLPSFTRPELNFHIVKDNGASKHVKWKHLTSVIKTLSDEKDILTLKEENTSSGLIFTPFASGDAGCYKVSMNLKKKFGADVRFYSATIPKGTGFNNDQDYDRYKAVVQEEFKNNRFPLMVATKAFGMGIDKPNIRYTIHYGIPGSLEALYQEAGRAGRDKSPADCFVLFSEESTGQQYFEQIFGLQSRYDQIQSVLQEVGFDQRDCFKQLYFWTIGVKNIDEEMTEIKAVFKQYGKPGGEVLIHGKPLGLTKSHLEKAIYKLSLMGIVDDWTIHKWNDSMPVLHVTFKDYTLESVRENVVNYIRKYEPEFSLYESYQRDPQKTDFSSIYRKEEIHEFYRLLQILLTWQYENVAYHRRQSILTVYQQCQEKAEDPEAFKKYMEAYFKFSDSAFAFDYIAENPRDFKNWFDIFFKEDQQFVGKEAIAQVMPSLRRFLESYRSNSGLNFVSGVIHLLTGQYQKDDGKQRLEDAFQSIREFGESERKEILRASLLIAPHMDEVNRSHFSKLLLDEFPEEMLQIYDKSRDPYSKKYVLDHSVGRIKKLVEGVI
ncbi:RecQ family ATP-dependent DNA helicase [Anoxynatronum sibiricum]|uniref:DNA 3'-5' helicase n=1 Tax=Anoxynatronum sibiricum TaxID=210623 RepID=A0ABU9VX19_9CLOT